MGQAPFKNLNYLLIGDGRLASHLSFYFKHSNIPFLTWSRKQNTTEELYQKLSLSDVVLLSIKDSALLEFYQEFLEGLENKIYVHFSGAFQHKNIYGFHPLMTFSKNLYSPEFYKTISFVSTYDDPEFHSVFPKLSNPNFKIPVDKKALYHSYCVVAGNFTNMLWKSIYERFLSQLQLPDEALNPYLEAVFSNLKKDPMGSLTGPIARDDQTTIQKNINSLEGDTLKSVYLSFYQHFLAEKDKKETPREHLEL